MMLVRMSWLHVEFLLLLTVQKNFGGECGKISLHFLQTLFFFLGHAGDSQNFIIRKFIFDRWQTYADVIFSNCNLTMNIYFIGWQPDWGWSGIEARNRFDAIWWTIKRTVGVMFSKYFLELANLRRTTARLHPIRFCSSVFLLFATTMAVDMKPFFIGIRCRSIKKVWIPKR